MSEFIKIMFDAVGIIAMGAITCVVIPAISTWRNNNLTTTQQQQLTYWVTVAVNWAKQWMQSASGAEKKAKVMAYVQEKVQELGLPFSDEDIDKSIEAVYSTVKDVVDAATGEVDAHVQ
jgi:hypothetical protein